MKERTRDIPAWGVGGANSAKPRVEHQSAFSLAKVVSRRASGKRRSEETPAGNDHRGATGESGESCGGGFAVASGDDRDQARQRECSHRGQSGFGGVAHRAGVFARMIGLLAGTRIWIAAGVTNLRRGFTGLSEMVQTALKENPFSGHVFVFRGRRGDLIKMLWWDGDGLCSPTTENPQYRI